MINTGIGTLLLGGQVVSILTNYSSKLVFEAVGLSVDIIKNTSVKLMALDQPYLIDVKSELDELDIIAKIDIISNLNEELKENFDVLPKHTQKSFAYILQILQTIEGEFKLLNERIEYHNTIYFANWRHLSSNDLIKNIKKHLVILDKRLDLFFKVYNIKN